MKYDFDKIHDGNLVSVLTLSVLSSLLVLYILLLSMRIARDIKYKICVKTVINARFNRMINTIKKSVA